MSTKFLVTGSVEDDLKALGVKGLTESSIASLAGGRSMSEAKCEGEDCDDEDEDEDDDDDEDEGDEEEYDESRHDPLDGPFVTPILFDRIMALPFENLGEDDIDAVISQLAKKRIPGNISGIREQAERVASRLMEVRAEIKRERVARKGTRKRRFECPPGYRKGAKPGQCVRAVVALGGAGKLAKQRRKKARWSRSGKGSMSATKSARRAMRYGGGESFAVELEHMISEANERDMSVRAEILDRMASIVELIAEEFDDESVTTVMSEAFEPLAASYDAGRLDEDVMNADAFLGEIKPLMAVISKALDRMERSDLGNV